MNRKLFFSLSHKSLTVETDCGCQDSMKDGKQMLTWQDDKKKTDGCQDRKQIRSMMGEKVRNNEPCIKT